MVLLLRQSITCAIFGSVMMMTSSGGVFASIFNYKRAVKYYRNNKRYVNYHYQRDKNNVRGKGTTCKDTRYSFESSVLIDFTGNPTEITSQELSILEQEFKDTYNYLSAKTCQKGYRLVDSVDIETDLDPGPQRRSLQGTPTSFTLNYRVKASRCGCPLDDKLFSSSTSYVYGRGKGARGKGKGTRRGKGKGKGTRKGKGFGKKGNGGKKAGKRRELWRFSKASKYDRWRKEKGTYTSPSYQRWGGGKGAVPETCKCAGPSTGTFGQYYRKEIENRNLSNIATIGAITEQDEASVESAEINGESDKAVNSDVSPKTDTPSIAPSLSNAENALLPDPETTVSPSPGPTQAMDGIIGGSESPSPGPTQAVDGIIGGSDAPAGRYPYYVFIKNTETTGECGGSLIDPDWVLTAAHCIESSDPSSYEVTIGLLDRNDPENGGQPFEEREVDEVIIHPSYNDDLFPADFGGESHGYDAALLKLKVSSEISLLEVDGVAWEMLAEGDDLDVIGFGVVQDADIPGAEFLQTAVVAFTPNDVCEALNEPDGFNIDDRIICAAGEDGVDSCRGDSGGPLLIAGASEDGSEDVLVGIVSFGSCDGLGGYTRIDGVIFDWINENIDGNISPSNPPSQDPASYESPSDEDSPSEPEDPICSPTDDGDIVCTAAGFPEKGLFTVFEGCSSDNAFECESCTIFFGDNNLGERCDDCTVCPETENVAFDCLNIDPDDVCFERDCDDNCIGVIV